MSDRDRDPVPSVLQRVLQWLRGGYPAGVPGEDYIALLGILHRRLTDLEVDHIAGELAQHADADTTITEDEIRDLIRQRVHERASDDDVARVAARLAAGGWPLAEVSGSSPHG